MTNPSIPDRAAYLVARAREVQAQIDALKDAGGPWTIHSLIKSDALAVAQHGMEDALQLLQKVEAAVRERLDEIKGKRK